MRCGSTPHPSAGGGSGPAALQRRSSLVTPIRIVIRSRLSASIETEASRPSNLRYENGQRLSLDLV